MGIVKTEKMTVLPAPILRRAIRQAAGVTQDEIAERIGVTRAAVSRWESGTRTPWRRNRVRYRDVLTEISGEDTY